MANPLPKYDRRVIDDFAATLYRQAHALVISGAIVGAIVGGFLGWAIGWTIVKFGIAYIVSGSVTAVLTWLAGTAIGGYQGAANGRTKGARLRLEAQTALCQAQIEENTRRA